MTTGDSTALVLAAVGSSATLILSIIKIVVDYMSKGREHQWLVDQEIRLQNQRIREAESIKIQQAIAAADVKAHAERKADAIVAKINENTAVNVEAIKAGEKAYTEANNLSIKMQQQGLQLRAPARKSDRPDDDPLGSGSIAVKRDVVKKEG